MDTPYQIFISDRLAAGILVLSASGEYQATFGRKGGGPGEFGTPSVIRVGPDSLIWVLDGPQRRLTQFSTDGRFEGTFASMANSFALLESGQLLFPPPFGSNGALALWDGESIVPASVILEGTVGPGNWQGLTEAGWLMSQDDDGNVFLLDNLRGSAWSISTKASPWVAIAAPFPMPIADLALRKSRARKAALALPEGSGVAIPLYRDLQHLDDGRLWVSTGFVEMLGVWLDFDARNAVVVLVSEHREHERLRFVAPIGSDRLLALYDQEARLLKLASSPVPQWLQR